MKLFEKSPVKRAFLQEISNKLSIKVEIKGNIYEETVDIGLCSVAEHLRNWK